VSSGALLRTIRLLGGHRATPHCHKASDDHVTRRTRESLYFEMSSGETKSMAEITIKYHDEASNEEA
jgi:hypothetical protein